MLDKNSITQYNAGVNMNTTISYFDLSRQYKKIGKDILRKIEEVASISAFSGGAYVSQFEANFAKFVGANYVVGVNSGTSALHLSLIAADVKKGDEVIVPALTFIATAEVVSYLGATPIFIDSRPDSWQIDTAKIEAKITKKTKAIIGVHLFGQCFDIDSILRLSKKHQLVFIEDCAQAHGTKYGGKMVGTFGDFGCFSFYPSKNLGAWGEAGAIVVKKRSIAQRLKKLRDHGQKKKYYHDEVGFNYRMDGIQAAVLDTKLTYLPTWNKRRKEIATRYFTEIINKRITFQQHPSWSDSVFHLFVVLVDNRKKMLFFLEKHNIFPTIHYPVPLHRQQAYSSLHYKKGNFPNTEYYSEHAVSLPMYPELTDAEVSKIIAVVNSYS